MLAMAAPVLLRAEAPGWWTTQGVLSGTTSADYAPATQGQLKALARAARNEMGAGASPEINAMVGGWSADTSEAMDYSVVTLGALKATAKPFYDKLGQEPPWTLNTTDDMDYAIATLGQVKNVFSFEISSPISLSFVTDYFLVRSGDFTEPIQLIAEGVDGSGYPLDLSDASWSVDGGGTLEASGNFGTFTSNGTEGAFTVTIAYGAVSATAAIIVYTPLVTELVITPANTATPSDGSEVCEVFPTLLDQYGASLGSPPQGTVLWSVDTGGSAAPLEESAYFIPDGTLGTFRITAFYQEFSASSWITVYTLGSGTTAISPNPAQIAINSSQVFRAVAIDSEGNLLNLADLAWSVNGGGTIAGSGASATFASSGTTGTYTVTATNAVVSAAALVSVQARALAQLSISPMTSAVPTGGQRQFHAAGRDQFGDDISVASPAWNISGGGTLGSSGTSATFTSDGTLGTYTLTITSGTVSGTATVMVQTPTFSRLEISPNHAAIATGDQQQFSATGKDQFDGNISSGSVAWSVSGGGTINGSGLFTSSGTRGIFYVTASAGAISGTATLNVSTALRPGFDVIAMERNDDGFTHTGENSDHMEISYNLAPGQLPAKVPLGFNIKFFGSPTSSVYINTNGNITFDGALSAFVPVPIIAGGRRIIAPFWADVDTRNFGSNVVKYGSGIVNGHQAFGVTWRDVGYYDKHADKLNTFQMILIEREDQQDGDFDVEFNYARVLWENGDASGVSVRAGMTNGTDITLELAGSGTNGAMLDSGTNALITHNRNSSTSGRYVFQIRDGVLVDLFNVSAGSDRTVSGLSTSLSASIPNPNGNPVTYQWSQVSTGGSTVEFSSQSVASPTVTAPSYGMYRFKIEVSDGEITASDIVNVIFEP